MSNLGERLRSGTRVLHRAAESSGAMNALLHGELAREEYCVMLRGFEALYSTLEGALERNAAHPAVAPIRLPRLFRRAALRADLDAISADTWNAIPVPASMDRYLEHLERIAQEQPFLLAAHAYVRYLGDLSGGQVLGKIVQRSFNLADGVGTAFYTFGDEAAVASYKTLLREGIDALPGDESDRDAIVAEARLAFTLHIAFFAEIAKAPPSHAQCN